MFGLRPACAFAVDLVTSLRPGRSPSPPAPGARPRRGVACCTPAAGTLRPALYATRVSPSLGCSFPLSHRWYSSSISAFVSLSWRRSYRAVVEPDHLRAVRQVPCRRRRHRGDLHWLEPLLVHPLPGLVPCQGAAQYRCRLLGERCAFACLSGRRLGHLCFLLRASGASGGAVGWRRLCLLGGVLLL